MCDCSSPGITNEDADGLGRSKDTAAGVGGINQITAYGSGGNGGCSDYEEGLFTPPGNPENPRDFPDVNNTGKVDAVDTGLVRGAFNATAGVSAAYKRTLDVNAAGATGGRGSGNINAVDIGIVRGAFNDNCQAAP
jgi:hypothetical protein